MSIREANSHRVIQSGNSYGSRLKNNLTSLINKDFSTSPSYFEVKINDNETLIGVQITDNTSNATEKVDNLRKIIMKPGDILNCGDVIEWNSKKWLSTSVEMFSDIYYKGVIQETNNTLKVYKNGILCQIPCIISKGSISTEDNRVISLSENEYNVLISSANIQNIFLNQRYLLSGDAYSLQGVDKLSQVGLLNLKIKKDVLNTNDDLINGIAYNGEDLTTDIYEVKLLNNPLVTLPHWSIWQLEYEVLKNGNVVDLPIIFNSSNSTSVSVDSTGRCVALNVPGTSTIKIMLQSNTNIFTFMTITVSNVVEHNYTVSIDGDSFIYLGESKQFTSSIRDLGVLIPDANVIWNLDYNNNPSSIALMSNTSDDKIVSILANANTTVGVIKLIAKYADDPAKMFIKEIEIKRKNLW